MRVENAESLTIDDLQLLSNRELKTLLREVSVVSQGVRDIIWQHAIEDELAQREKQ